MPLAGDPFSNPLRWEIIRGHADFVRLARSREGVWWLLNSEDRPFLSRGVAGIQPLGNESKEDLSRPLAEKFARWNCNTIGLESAGTPRPPGAWEIVTVPFCSAFTDTVIRGGGLCVPDVFDARWEQDCHALAVETGNLHRGERGVLGYGIDGGIQWDPGIAATKSGPRPRLLQVCLSLEPGFAAYHAAWEFVLAAHGGDWDRLLRDWAVDWPNREALRQRTRDEIAIATPGFWRDQENFLREFARRYFCVATEALRSADPHHLIFAGNALSGKSEMIQDAMAAAEVDALTREITEPADWATVERIAGEGRTPVVVTKFNWTAEKFRARHGRGSRTRSGVETMLANGRSALVRIQRHPGIVGYAWSDWQDAPGDRAPYGRGLIRENGDEALEHAELFALLNRTAEKTRAAMERRLRMALVG